ncbi:MAG: hypothetical protein JW747_03770 [Candidatus Aminicenantes bacterium]|nr:hypothetical protein [Candidatus Aminicenantes bacterium]
MISVAACFVAMAALHLLTPFWWWVMAVPFVFGLAAGRSVWRAARTGAAAAGALWLGAAVYSQLTGSALIARRMAALLGLGSPWLIIAATALAAAAAAGVSGLAGFALRALFMSRRRNR